MRLLLFFDLPTHTPAHRKAYAAFKKELKKLRFHRLQYSVYVRHCMDAHRGDLLKKVLRLVPKQGDIKIIPLADGTYERMTHVQEGRRRPHHPPAPLLVW